MVMRLVRDDDPPFDEVEVEGELEQRPYKAKLKDKLAEVTNEHKAREQLVDQEELLARHFGQLVQEQLAVAAAAAAAAAMSDSEHKDGAVEGPGDEDQRAAGAGGESSAADDAAAAAAVNLSALEALLLSTHSPLTPARLAELLDLPGTRPVKAAVQRLNQQYEQSGRSFRVEQVAGGYQILTLPEFGDQVRKLHQREGDAKLTKAALETLAIIAYKQPILRADVEAIRGVACGETIRSLMEKHLVKIAGRAEEPGRPILYGTTKRFLELFGLNTLKDLPQPEGAQGAAPKDPKDQPKDQPNGAPKEPRAEGA